MLAFLKWLFGTSQERTLRRYKKIVDDINLEEQKLQSLSEEELKKKTTQLKQRYAQGESLESFLPEAYAIVKNACRRLCGTDVHVSGYNQKWDMVPFDVQLLGAIALFHGSIAEMQTGEGKTLTAVMPLYLHSITGKPVHIVTVNDYLAKRDCEWVGSVLRFLGLTTGVVQQGMNHDARKEVYAKDVVYGTASELGFDYLRDNSMSFSKDEQVQRGHYFALVDEVDSILIDEARTPLIISGPSPISRQMYTEIKEGVDRLVSLQKNECQKKALEAKRFLDSLLDEKEKVQTLTEQQKDACHTLWAVSKGMPRNKVLKRLKEHPDIRAAIDSWDLHYYKEQNKKQRSEALSWLQVVVDERANEFELTERGIQGWIENGGHNDDFVMLDLGYELSQCDADPSLSTEEKMRKKVAIQEEDIKRKERAHNLRQMLRAHLLMDKDVDYIIQEGKVVIIDEHTGRAQPGRRFSDGLHQAIEAKEGVEIERETQTYATITLQNYFRLYERLAGMTGTAITEAHEFKEIYKLEVLQIPTHKKCIRKDCNDEMYMTEREKFQALLQEIRKEHEKGRPILVGTESVEVSEKLSRLLKLNRLEHTVLNAKNHTKEAAIIACAGHKGAITVATNMAGRGTDIKLEPGAADLGGLYVIGSTRHHSRRIDRQLRGRSGRQGDNGASKFYISLEDPLMRLFATPALTGWLQRFRPPEGEPIAAPILNKSIETAQKRIETRNYTIRKHTLEYDDVMNRQRQEIYRYRNDILHSPKPSELALEVIEGLFDSALQRYGEKGDMEGLRDFLMTCIPLPIPEEKIDALRRNKSAMQEFIQSDIHKSFHEKLAAEKELLLRSFSLPEEEAQKVIEETIRSILLRIVDSLWQKHLLEMDHLRTDVNIRAVGQKDPLMEFKYEAFSLFETLTMKLREESVRAFFHFTLVASRPDEEEAYKATERAVQLEQDRSFFDDLSIEPQSPNGVDLKDASRIVTLHADDKVGRNEECPCGSGKKFKKCCGGNEG